MSQSPSINAKKAWPLVRLGDVCQIVFGTRVRRRDSSGDQYPVYGGGGETFRWATFNREDQCVVARFAMSAECVRFVSGKFFLNDSGLTVEAKDARLIQPYLDWCLFSRQDEIFSLGKGSAQKNLDVSEFANLQIPLPPLSHQRAIVEHLEKDLSETDRLAVNFKRITERAEDEFKAELEETFSTLMNLTKPLGDACAIKTGKKDVNQGNPDGQYPFFTCARIPTRADTYSFDCSALLIAGNGDVGFTQKYEGKFEVYQRTYVLYDFKGFLRDYIYYVLQRGFREYAGLNKLGVAMPYIKMGTLTNFAIPYVPISEQTAIVAKLDAAKARCEKLKAAAEKGLQGAENLRAAILAEAFEG